MPERTLKSGIVVRTRIVPTHAVVQVGAHFKRPVAPKVGYKSAAGHTEMKAAPEDSPEWIAFAQESADYDARVDKAKQDFIYDYAVIAWRNGSNEWQTEPPDDWEFPAIFKSHGIQPSESKRADYIRYELMQVNEDIAQVLDDALGKVSPITDSEVNAALGSFPALKQRRSYTRGEAKRRKGR